ncbi:MAG: dihydroorotase [Cyanobacteria bacterium SZAS LIN-3]|nr:dihydroorotase [Cyanobacteria bacterium SZAS LIN-3]
MLIQNCVLVDPSVNSSVETKQDVRIDNGMIVDIGTAIPTHDSETVFDADGLLLMPGLIDLHTHLRDFGQGAKEDIATGTQAAAAGGYTTVVAMANTVPPIDNAMVYQHLQQMIADKAVIRVLSVANVTKGMAGKEVTEMAMLSELGAVAFSDDGLPVTNLAVMRRALEQARALGTLVISHPEDRDLSGAGVMNESATSTALGLAGVTTASEAVCVAREIEIARITGAHLHFAHISTIASIRLIERAKADGLSITADTTPHHLTLTDSDVGDFNTSFKMNPPLRSQADQDALTLALKNGTLDAIATDHAPHTHAEKGAGFNAAPCGVTGLETALPLCLERLSGKGSQTQMSRVEVLRKFTSGPAKILGLPEPSLAHGRSADVFLFDPAEKWTYSPRNGHSKSHNSPFNGRTLTGRVLLTLCQGRIAYQHEPAMGRWISIEGLALK